MTIPEEQIADYQWTHPSVTRLAGAGNPLAEVIRRARKVVLHASSEGWKGPPFDPMALAAIQGIRVTPCADIPDARTIPVANEGYLIEFNPNRPKSRINYSVAHEIAHTLFEDCREQIRHRGGSSTPAPDEWQLEMLCNVAAAELLMPLGSLPDFDPMTLTIERIGELRREFAVSTEAILLRAAKISTKAFCIFAASRIEEGTHSGRYRIDYAVPAYGWAPRLRRGTLLPADTVLSHCTAIGFTDKAQESWSKADGRLHVECVGVPPYHHRLYPRVLGFARPLRGKQLDAPTIKTVVGDATGPRGNDEKILVQIVNDKTPNWGPGFASAVRREWPLAQEEFQSWARSFPTNLSLGNVHFARLETRLTLGSMVAQHGYGDTPKQRVRYDALTDCLDRVREFAEEHGASVHMPRIGTGYAGGSWPIVEDVIFEQLVRHGVNVTVYDPPGAPKKSEPAQQELFTRQGVRRSNST